MEKCTRIVCDIDGVLNIMGDDSFMWDDVSHVLLRDDTGTPMTYFTFSPTVINSFASLNANVELIMLTSWNERVSLLKQIDLPSLKFAIVDNQDEQASKIAHLTRLAQDSKVLWIDDFAVEWEHLIPENIQHNVVALQPDHVQGISPDNLDVIHQHLGL